MNVYMPAFYSFCLFLGSSLPGVVSAFPEALLFFFHTYYLSRYFAACSTWSLAKVEMKKYE